MAQALREHAPMRVALRSEREDWIQYLVRTGRGVTILPEHSVVMDGLATVVLDREGSRRDVLLAVATGREDSAAVRDFIAMARRWDWP
jgi:DNA-binding transcriptional LysR family regulator